MSAPEASQISEQMEPGGRGAVAGEAWPGYCGGSQPAMTRTNAVALLIAAAAGCYTPARILPVPAAVVNDACGGNGTAETCAQTGIANGARSAPTVRPGRTARRGSARRPMRAAR